MKFNQIHNGDTLNFLKSIPSNVIDTIVTSPPYNIGKGKEKKNNIYVYLDYQKKVITECVRLLKKTGSIFWQVGVFTSPEQHIPLDFLIYPIFKDLNLYLKNRIIWPRAHGLQSKNRFTDRHESILWFTKDSKNYHFFLDAIRIPQLYPNKRGYKGPNKGKLTGNPNGKNPGDVWLFENVKHNHEEQTIHPAQFPETLVERIILATTKKNDVILDPYMGSGTTAIVSKNLNRRYLGAEIDKEYFELCQRRLMKIPINHKFVNLKQLRAYYKLHPDLFEKNFRFDKQICEKPDLIGKTNLILNYSKKEELWNAISVLFLNDLKVNGS